MFTKLSQRDIKIDILEMVQTVLETPEFRDRLIAVLPDDMRSPMTAIAAAVTVGDQTAAQAALDALCGDLEG